MINEESEGEKKKPSFVRPEMRTAVPILRRDRHCEKLKEKTNRYQERVQLSQNYPAYF